VDRLASSSVQPITYLADGPVEGEQTGALRASQDHDLPEQADLPLRERYQRLEQERQHLVERIGQIEQSIASSQDTLALARERLALVEGDLAKLHTALPVDVETKR
jgi:hypothetical protein